VWAEVSNLESADNQHGKVHVESVLQLSDKELDLLAQKIGRERDFDCGQFRQTYFRRRVSTRMRATSSADVSRYMRLLDTDGDEWNRLISTLTVNVTEFFRDRGTWEFLAADVCANLLAAKERRGQSFVRVWSAGCSTGQEPYGLAMLFAEAAGESRSRATVRITASDYDRDCLAKAKAGLYTEDEAVGIDRSRRLRFTTREAGGVRMSRELRGMIRFMHLDLFSDHDQRLMDLILCRNVLMYFTPAQQTMALRKFVRALNPGGYLVLGKSEKLKPELYGEFVNLSLAERVYQKRPPEEAS
jgi:chemotaxis methyl-accepting protein methylase